MATLGEMRDRNELKVGDVFVNPEIGAGYCIERTPEGELYVYRMYCSIISITSSREKAINAFARNSILGESKYVGNISEHLTQLGKKLCDSHSS